MFITSENTDKLFQALFEFQKECPTIEKKASGGYKGTKYADRTDVIQVIRPFLSKNNLFFTQAACSSQAEYIGMTSRIVHSPSNQWIEATEARAAGRLDFVNKEGKLELQKGLSQPQADGCVLTYMSRQQLVYLLGIPLVGEDNEGALAHYMPLNSRPKSLGVPPKDPIDIYYEKGHRLLEEMNIISDRASAIYEYCVKKGYKGWSTIPKINFKEDKDLHAILKLNGNH